MNPPDFEGVEWRKSSFSAENGTCVEVAFSGPAVGVRDSTSPASGQLNVGAEVWIGFIRRADRQGLKR